MAHVAILSLDTIRPKVKQSRRQANPSPPQKPVVAVRVGCSEKATNHGRSGKTPSSGPEHERMEQASQKLISSSLTWFTAASRG